MPVLKPQALIGERVAALQKAHNDARIDRAELDLSGGIDSAVMACLLVKALGPENVTLVHSRFATNPSQTERATRLGLALGCPAANCALGGVYADLMTEFKNALSAAGYNIAEIKARMAADPTIEGSIRSTLRAPIGRALNRMTGGGLRHGTGNEDEDRFIRFYQKGGDGEVDSNPIAFLSKGEVYQLALALGKDMGPEVMAALLPIIEAQPSPDLWGTGDAHSDESELQKWLGVPFTYSRISVETGAYTTVGTIERMNRTLDLHIGEGAGVFVRDMLFREDPLRPHEMDRLVTMARRYFPAPGTAEGRGTIFTYEEVASTLLAARRAEASTRHKMNPNCPAYGDRRTLVEAGILTNLLPL